MKKATRIRTLLVVVGIIVCGGLSLFQAQAMSGMGEWRSPTWIPECMDSKICAEWYEPGGLWHGAVCCIADSAISSSSFSSCEVLLRDPRPPGLTWE